MNRDLRPLALVTQLGVTMAASIVLSLLLGIWIDNTFNTKPWATLVLAIAGIVLGSVAVYRMVAQAIDAAVEAGDIEADQSEGDRKKKSSKRRKENE